METKDYFKKFIEEKEFNNLSEEIDFESIFKIIQRKTSFNKYSVLIDFLKLSTDSQSVKNKIILDKLINNETEFKEFLQILLHTAQDKVVLKLDPSMTDLCDLTQCDPQLGHKSRFSFGEINSRDILIKNERSLSSMSGIYPMYCKPRGYCLLINNYFTIGTFKEMQRFRNIFYQLHFEVKMKKNLSIGEIKNLLTDISKSSDISQHNAFVLMIITHGNDNEEILDLNDNSIKIEELTEIFDNINCPQLKLKPKLFFFNCCRGNSTEHLTVSSLAKGIPPEENSISSIQNTGLPNKTDILVCYSTLDGQLAFVDWNTGTKFGDSLAKSLVEKGWYKDINAIITRTNNKQMKYPNSNGTKQTVEWRLTLTHDLYFSPTIPDIIPHPLISSEIEKS